MGEIFFGLGSMAPWLEATATPALETAGWAMQAAAFVLLGHSHGASLFSYLAELLLSSLNFGALFVTDRWTPWALAAHCALAVTVFTKAAVEGRFLDSAFKFVIEYAFFMYMICCGAVTADWYIQGVPAMSPCLRCFAAVAQLLHCKSNKYTGALSLPACALLAAAQWTRVLTAETRGLVPAGHPLPTAALEVVGLMVGDWRTLRALACSALCVLVVMFGSKLTKEEQKKEAKE